MTAKYIPRTYGGQTAQQRHFHRQQRFLQAGLDAMTRSGGTATLAAIIATSGLSARYFYECFDGLDRLLIGIFDWIVEECALAAAAAIETSGTGPHSAIKASVIGVMDALTADPRWARFILDPAIGGSHLAPRRTKLTGDIAFLLREPQNGNAGRCDPKFLAVQSEILVAGARGATLAWLHGRLPLKREELVEYCARYVDGSLLSSGTETHLSQLLRQRLLDSKAVPGVFDAPS
ncbi:TetR/AcrR family transcriptional regulator [Mycobacteroides salmoniphilum]|uniref:TetR/AcrR family transcriptional regulator n=1 Tax=Mycobacteroides salmoniphilum TaxID=404941 RepID=UPI0012FF7F7F|nr:TetR/AcrR family transcriptional regulator [Mycobacteroides salmoniphilum]